MPKLRMRTNRRGELTWYQKSELVCGQTAQYSNFTNPSDRRAAWFDRRGELLEWGNYRPGSRPWAFWEYEGPPELRDDDRVSLEEHEALEQARIDWLRRTGQLSARERLDLDIEEAACRA